MSEARRTTAADGASETVAPPKQIFEIRKLESAKLPTIDGQHASLWMQQRGYNATMPTRTYKVDFPLPDGADKKVVAVSEDGNHCFVAEAGKPGTWIDTKALAIDIALVVPPSPFKRFVGAVRNRVGALLG